MIVKISVVLSAVGSFAKCGKMLNCNNNIIIVIIIVLKMLKVAYVEEKDEPLVPQTWLGSLCVSGTLEASSKPE